MLFLSYILFYNYLCEFVKYYVEHHEIMDFQNIVPVCLLLFAFAHSPASLFISVPFGDALVSPIVRKKPFARDKISLY